MRTKSNLRKKKFILYYGSGCGLTNDEEGMAAGATTPQGDAACTCCTTPAYTTTHAQIFAAPSPLQVYPGYSVHSGFYICCHCHHCYCSSCCYGQTEKSANCKAPGKHKEKKIFPMLKMGNFTMQGARTLYTTTIDGLKTENINEGITDLGGADKCLLSLLSVC